MFVTYKISKQGHFAIFPANFNCFLDDINFKNKIESICYI